MQNKKLGLNNSEFLLFIPHLLTLVNNRMAFPTTGTLTYYKDRICRLLEFNTNKIVTLQMISSNSNDCIELDTQETNYIKQLCTKYSLEEPECNLQTLNNLILLENPSLRSLSSIAELVESSDEGLILMTTMILLNHDNTTKSNNTSNNP